MSSEARLASVESESDALAALEERIRRAVELVAALRAERDEALAAAETAHKQATTAMAEIARLKEAEGEAGQLRQELDSLRSERKQVRTRIEKLLGQMDLLSGQ